MDPSDPAAPGVPQSSSTTRSDDDYDLSASVIADGFRPTQPSPSPEPAQRHAPNPQPKTTPGSHRPSSTSKPPSSHDSLTLRNDGSSSARPRLPSSVQATGDDLMQPESPYRGPIGPSHPYTMYPQRTFSMATSSTAHNSNRQSYVGPRGPTHPYALYTQSTVAGDDAGHQDIPVGFTGLGNAYQRQLGPDGEEAGDLIGPLGHMEELPPYTRYPEDSHARRKPPEPVSNTSPSSAEATPGPQPIPGAGGLGIATRNPEFSSTEDDLPAMSHLRPTSRSGGSQHEINTAARDISEKSTMTNWQRRARKKLWGIVPLWAIGLLTVGIVIVAVVLGAVIGTVLAKDKAPESQSEGKSSGRNAEPQPLQSVPPNLAPLAEGSFSLPPIDISQGQKSCFLDTAQSQAWSCDVPFRFYSMSVARVSSAPETNNYVLTMSATNDSSSKSFWGSQPHSIPDPKPLTLVETSEEDRGPAWWLKVKYEKTVIVPEDKFPGKNTKRARQYRGPDEDGFGPPPRFVRKKIAQAGDRPWICIWPETTLDVFIYPGHNVSTPTTGTSKATSPTMASDIANTTPDFGPSPMPAYPKVIKFRERRWRNDPRAAARCHQVEIRDDGRKEDLKDADGNNIETVIEEDWKKPSEQMTQRERDRNVFDERSYPNQILSRDVLGLTDCGCLWRST